MSSVSRRDALLLAATAVVTVPLTLKLAGAWPVTAVHFGDNDAYVTVADALRSGDFRDVVPQQFWGVSYVVAAISAMTSLDGIHALWVCSWITAAVTIWLAVDLWGGTVGAWFGVASFPWLQRAALGGSEPLFMCLLLAAFVLARRTRWLPATAVASVSAMVRPIGGVLVAAVLFTLVRRRDWRSLLAALGIATAMIAAYAVPLWLAYGDPWANVRWYRDQAWAGHTLPVALPLVPIARGWLLDPPRAANALKTVAWLAIVSGGCVALVARDRARAMWDRQPVEAAFALGGLLFVCCYNAPFWSQKEFARFVLPVVPFALAGLEPWLPTRRTVLWPVSILSGVLAAGSLLQT